jgi:hypothetical protein
MEALRSGSSVLGQSTTCVWLAREWLLLSRMGNLLWIIIVVLVILWLAGFAMHIGGGLIHLLIVVAVIVLIIQLVTGRRAI